MPFKMTVPWTLTHVYICLKKSAKENRIFKPVYSPPYAEDRASFQLCVNIFFGNLRTCSGNTLAQASRKTDTDHVYLHHVARLIHEPSSRNHPFDLQIYDRCWRLAKSNTLRFPIRIQPSESILRWVESSCLFLFKKMYTVYSEL